MNNEYLQKNCRLNAHNIQKQNVPGIPYSSVMKMILMAKIEDLQITAIPSYDRGLIFFTVATADSGWRKLHNDELHDVHSSPSITCMTK